MGVGSLQGKLSKVFTNYFHVCQTLQVYTKIVNKSNIESLA